MINERYERFFEHSVSKLILVAVCWLTHKQVVIEITHYEAGLLRLDDVKKIHLTQGYLKVICILHHNLHFFHQFQKTQIETQRLFLHDFSFRADCDDGVFLNEKPNATAFASLTTVRY